MAHKNNYRRVHITDAHDEVYTQKYSIYYLLGILDVDAAIKTNGFRENPPVCVFV